MSNTIRQTVTLKAPPRQVYEALMDSRKHAKFTGAKARISTKVGGSFSAFDGGLSGKNLELVPGKKIVQSWRSADWPADHYSRVSFTLLRVKGGTRLRLTHTGIPVTVTVVPIT